jgi:hypothetical protein
MCKYCKNLTTDRDLLRELFYKYCSMEITIDDLLKDLVAKKCMLYPDTGDGIDFYIGVRLNEAPSNTYAFDNLMGINWGSSCIYKISYNDKRLEITFRENIFPMYVLRSVDYLNSGK